MAARYILRVDIGTHAVKVSTVDHLGNRIGNIVSNPLTVIERPTVVGFGERVTKNAVMVIDGKQFITRLQDFNHLRSTVLETMKAGIAEAESAGADRASYKGIGTSGAMHTDQPFAGKDDNGILVPIEDDFATMWNSEHNGIEFDMLMNIPGLREMILHATSNEPMQRGILTKMLFRKLNDLNWESTTRFLSANNWITHVLTGSNSFEMSDAISAIDPRTGLYAVDLLKFFGLSGKLPTIVDSEESVGTLLPHVADQLGLSKNVIVAAGGGDQRMALFGNGIVRPGRVALNWGASGTILAHTGGKFDPTGRINTFGPNIPWFMNCCMATGLSLDRFSEASKIAVKDIAAYAMTSRIDANGVVMWPWFGVTNAPYKSLGTDPYYENWRGANPADQARAVLNGSVIEMLKCVDQLKQLGTPVESIRFSGGGANSDLLANIIASYTGLPVEVPEDIEASSVGAGISAMVATNEFGSVEEACDATIKFRDPIKPNLQDQDALRALAQKYDDDFQRLYPEAWKRHHEAKKI